MELLGIDSCSITNNNFLTEPLNRAKRTAIKIIRVTNQHDHTKK
jgi:hypothetical protein